jgi:hypothetical protein
MLAKHWCERGDNDAGHRLVTAICAGRKDRCVRFAGRRDHRGRHSQTHPAVKRFHPEKGLPSRHQGHLVDPGIDSGMRTALVVAGENGHHRHPDDAVIQPPQD